MKKKSKILLLLITAMLVFCLPVSANAMSAANKKAHKAFSAQLKKDKRQFRNSSYSGKLKYAYADIDGDKVDELITEPGYGYCTQIIYDYQNGKVKQVAIASQGTFTTYYPKHKVIFVKKSGHMGYLADYYLKQSKKTYQLVADVGYEYKSFDYSKKPLHTTYAVNNIVVNKKSYMAYTKSLVKGEKGKSFKSLKWKKY